MFLWKAEPKTDRTKDRTMTERHRRTNKVYTELGVLTEGRQGADGTKEQVRED